MLDPTTGRFTQEDPIGLAGGVNLYGFASGDPVSFRDPFGLCPIPIDDCPPGFFTAMGAAIGAVGGGFGGGAGGAIVCSPGGGAAIACGVGGGVAGAKTGAAIGGVLGGLLDAGIAFMSRSRGQGEAVDRARDLLPQLGLHMDALRAGGPDDRDARHHATEAHAWIDRIERLSGQMRGRTQRAWRELVETLRNEISQIMQQE